MKRTGISIILLTALLTLVWYSGAEAQLPVIVQGVVLNPDSTLPNYHDIQYISFIIGDSTDKQIDSVAAGGGWGVELLFGFSGGLRPWSAGDTLFIRFKNISGGLFNGSFSRLKYVTTNEPLQPPLPDTTALPVEMTELIALFEQNATGAQVRLTWKTFSETNNHGFEIQRSRDHLHYQTLGFIAGAGTTSAPRTYEYIDKEVSSGTYYYRIKQIDANGIVHFTDAQSVEVIAPTRYALHQNFPNPFNPTTEIVYHIKEKGEVSLVVYNILGREIATLVNSVQEAGIHHAVFTAAGIPSGVYFYRLRVNEFDQVRKMAVLK